MTGDVWGGCAIVGVGEAGVEHADQKLFDIVAEAEELAATDGLTGLMNRRAFQESLDTAIARARRNQTPGALIYVDLDNFKAINDTYGHETGDNVLTEVAQILTSRSRTYDLVARIGGDEFVVWLDGVEFSVAKRRAGELALDPHLPSPDREDDFRAWDRRINPRPQHAVGG